MPGIECKMIEFNEGKLIHSYSFYRYENDTEGFLMRFHITDN